jgi:hypothetical protein
MRGSIRSSGTSVASAWKSDRTLTMGCGKFLIEGEQARHVRALSCCQRRAQVLRELPLQVEGILDRRRLYVWV